MQFFTHLRLLDKLWKKIKSKITIKLCDRFHLWILCTESDAQFFQLRTFVEFLIKSSSL